MDSIIPLFVIVPLAIAFLIPLIWKVIPAAFKFLPAAGTLFLMATAFRLLITSGGETLTCKVGGWEPVKDIPIGIHMVVDGLSMSMLIIINLIGFLTALYSIPYMKKFTGENFFFVLFSLMIAGMNGVVITGDLFNLFVFLEISVISSYALVAFGSSKDELEASFKYQVLGGIASLLILFALAITYWYTSTLNMSDISKLLQQAPVSRVTIFIQLFFIAGFGLKAALIPFHSWLPDADRKSVV